ncbi:MAG TPA: hypothetical protein VGH98_22110 [Gemmatimonadaceae bacterium]|jgi:hypothetical protein
MRFSLQLLSLTLVGAAACGPTYVVQSRPTPAPERVPVPPRVSPLEVSIVRAEDGRVLIQTSRPAYAAVFEIVPGRGVSLVYPEPTHPRDVELTGLTWVDVYWTMRYDSRDRRFASYDTRYIYAVASDTPLRFEDSDYERGGLERRLGSTFFASTANVTVRAISREFVRAQPDEWWGEDMFSVSMAPARVTVTIRFARVYCPGGNYFEVREDLANHVWCPPRTVARGRPPVTEAPDSVFGSTGHRVPRRMDPSARTPVFRVPAATDVGHQQGEPHNPPPRNVPPTYPRSQPNNPQTPATNQPQTPPQNQPPQNQPPQIPSPPAQTPPQSQPPQTQPQDTGSQGKDHQDNGRRAHGDPRNADPRGNGNGYGNGGRSQQPSTQPPATSNPSSPSQSNPQPQQQGQPQNQPGNNGRGNGNGNAGNGNNGNSGNNGKNGKNANDAKPQHNDAPKNSRLDAIMKKVNPPPSQKQDDKGKKAASDSTDKDKKKP